MTSAEYGEQDGLNANANCYDEKILKYDDNSRIMRLQRRGMKDNGKFGEVDNLQLNYSAGHLAAVSDKADAVNQYAQMEFKDGSNDAQEYKYNNVGCLIRDTNKGINNIIYDYLNHPKRIEFKNGNNIEYVYNVDGSKIMTKSSGKTSLAGANEQDETNYLNDFIFSKNDTKCVFDGGYASINGTNVAFHYYTKDHLGNNRIVKNEKGQVEQVNHYYPFGGVITNISTNPFLQKYKYNGKELDRTHGLDWYDYGARMYDPVLAMWTSVDPLAEKYRNLDSYLYCANNPVKNIDPDGKDNVVFMPLANDDKHDNISLIDYAIQNKSAKNRTDIFVHGSPISMEFYATDVPSGTIIHDIDEMQNFENENQYIYNIKLEKDGTLSSESIEMLSEIFRQSSEWKEGSSTVVLHSCYTGAETLTPTQYNEITGKNIVESIPLNTNIAKEISKAFPGNTIIAPTGKVSPQYKYLFFGNVSGNVIHDNGYWNVYQNGKKTNKISSNDL